MARIKTIRAFEEWKKDEAGIEELLARLAGGEKLHKACLEIKRPYTLVLPFLRSTPELQARYEAALATAAEAHVHEALEIADEVKGSEVPAEVSAAKLRVETRHKTAAWFNRERFGERIQVEKTVKVGVDAGLLGTVADMLRGPVRTEKLVEQVPAGASQIGANAAPRGEVVEADLLPAEHTPARVARGEG